ncbi:MAG TPA: biotin--[acetyl-CoA-carboxylase] ligase [Moheibacter sp.]|nr:biotin--[acetyl-CoA-carboxylase] ligase [Moheibacter sp.]
MEIIYFKSLPSTNTKLLNLSKKSAKSWTVVWTSKQTEGKAYGGGKWEIEKSKNLAVSLLITNDLSYKELVYFNQWMGVTIQRYLKRFSDSVYVKWPNDIIMKNKKICGLLIETYKSDNELNIITGIGLNVNQEEFKNLPKAGSLFTQTRQTYDLEEILTGLLTEIQENYHLISEKKFTQIAEDYNAVLYCRNRIAKFEYDEKLFKGIILGVNEHGQLIVQTDSGEVREFNHKEIELIY